MAVQCHPTPLILGTNLKHVGCNLRLVMNSNRCPILLRFRYIADFLLKKYPPQFHPNFGGVSVGTDRQYSGSVKYQDQDMSWEKYPIQQVCCCYYCQYHNHNFYNTSSKNTIIQEYYHTTLHCRQIRSIAVRLWPVLSA